MTNETLLKNPESRQPAADAAPSGVRIARMPECIPCRWGASAGIAILVDDATPEESCQAIAAARRLAAEAMVSLSSSDKPKGVQNSDPLNVPKPEHYSLGAHLDGGVDEELILAALDIVNLAEWSVQSADRLAARGNLAQKLREFRINYGSLAWEEGEGAEAEAGATPPLPYERRALQAWTPPTAQESAKGTNNACTPAAEPFSGKVIDSIYTPQDGAPAPAATESEPDDDDEDDEKVSRSMIADNVVRASTLVSELMANTLGESGSTHQLLSQVNRELWTIRWELGLLPDRSDQQIEEDEKFSAAQLAAFEMVRASSQPQRPAMPAAESAVAQ